MILAEEKREEEANAAEDQAKKLPPFRASFDVEQFRRAVTILNGRKQHHETLFLFTAHPSADGDHNGHMTAQMYDGIHHTKVTFAANVQSPGSVLLPISKMPKVLCEASGEMRVALLASGCAFRGISEYTCPVVKQQSHPHTFVQHPPLGTITVSLSEFKSIVSRVIFACGEDDPELQHRYSCIKLHCDNDSIRILAASMRICATISMPKGSAYVGDFLLRHEGFQAINRLKGDLLCITFHEKGVSFQVSGDVTTDIYIPESNGTLPNYQQELTARGTTQLTGSRQEFLYAAKTAKNISDCMTIKMVHNDRTYRVQDPFILVRDPDGLVQKTVYPDMKWTGPDHKCKIRTDTFFRCLVGTRGNVTIGFQGEYGVITIWGDQDDYMAVTMPFTRDEER